jgi:monothiol glutaredoxin
LYVRGEFVGGCDIIEESYAAHELHETLRVEPAAADSPEISISDDAAEQLRRAIAQAPEGSVLRFAVDARHRCRLFLAPGETGDASATAGGVTLQMDPLSASRAGGARIDTVQSGKGVAFRVGLANSPFVAHPMTVKELASHLEADAALELFDVRPPNERATASIKKAIPMDAEQAQRVESLPRDTLLVFHCHHGQRSQVAAEHFASLGFTNAHNLLGGIESWSLEIDASIPRY